MGGKLKKFMGFWEGFIMVYICLIWGDNYNIKFQELPNARKVQGLANKDCKRFHIFIVAVVQCFKSQHSQIQTLGGQWIDPEGH